MPGRLLLAGGLLWLTLKPNRLPGDRYELLGVVINLTGVGNATRQCALGTADWTLRPIEINLETLAAGAVLDQIEAGSAPPELLAFIPLMQGGEEDAIIQRWRRIVGAEADLRRRADYALALVFADRVDRRASWQQAVKGFSMIESPVIAELLGKAKGESLLRVLRKLHGELPAELANAIRDCSDGEQVDQWLDVAVEAQTLEQFRQQTGL